MYLFHGGVFQVFKGFNSVRNVFVRPVVDVILLAGLAVRVLNLELSVSVKGRIFV